MMSMQCELLKRNKRQLLLAYLSASFCCLLASEIDGYSLRGIIYMSRLGVIMQSPHGSKRNVCFCCNFK